MRIHQLQTAKDFYMGLRENYTLEQVMQMYAEHVAKKFAAECVNEALGNKMIVSNALHAHIESRYKSIIWVEGVPKMNVEALRARMEEFFSSVSPDVLVEEFERMGYKFEPIKKEGNE